MKHLILGGTGTVGSEVVKGLLAKNEKVKVLTRSQEKADTLPAGAEAIIGDLMNTKTYENIFSDFDNLFLLNALNQTELQEGLAALNEAKRARAKRIVYLSVHDVGKGPGIPHFASKIVIENALKQSGVPYVIIRPNNFYQNDYWFKEAILNFGVYPQPIGDIGLSRVDTRDIGQAAVNALTSPAFENETYTLAGPDSLTGKNCAEIWSKALGKKIQYGGNDLNAWEKQALEMLPAWLVYDFKLMYAMFQDKGLRATDKQLKETKKIIGASPIKYSVFVKDTVSLWEKELHKA